MMQAARQLLDRLQEIQGQVLVEQGPGLDQEEELRQQYQVLVVTIRDYEIPLGVDLIALHTWTKRLLHNCRMSYSKVIKFYETRRVIINHNPISNTKLRNVCIHYHFRAWRIGKYISHYTSKLDVFTVVSWI